MGIYPEELLTEDEEVLREFHPHWRVLLPATGWLVLGVAVAVAGGVLLDNDIATYVALALGAVVVVVLAIPKFVSWRFKVYVLTNERIIVRDGIIRRGGTEIPLENINNVLFNQGVVERLLGYGDVLIESAGTSGQSRFTDIPDPEAFQSEVYRAREKRSMQMSGASGAQRDSAAQLKDLAELRDRGDITDEEYQSQKARLLGD